MENYYQPESLIIRPPSEWRSLLVRITRGCNWNRCRFCGIYSAQGEPTFSCRNLAGILHDIDLLVGRMPGAQTAFFGDADPLAAGLDIFVGAATYLRQCASIRRLTCYARVATLYKLGRKGVEQLGVAGLNRVHIGLESGNQQVLHFQRKGQAADMVIKVCKWLKAAGIEISCYVLLGLGGQVLAEQHIHDTVALLNIIQPDFIRLRRLWLYGNGTDRECPLWEQVRDGSFVEQTPEGTVREVQSLLAGLDPMDAFLASDHANNYINVSGNLRQDLPEMQAAVAAFLALPEEQRRAHYALVGSRI